LDISVRVLFKKINQAAVHIVEKAETFSATPTHHSKKGATQWNFQHTSKA
jgi:hypothetical protein